MSTLPNITSLESFHVGIIGYGRMGHEIENLLQQQGHSSYTVDTHNLKANYTTLSKIPEGEIKNTSVFIDFSLGNAILDNTAFYASQNIPVIIGATGWNNELDKITQIISNSGTSVLYGANFSIGAHLFTKASQYMAKLINKLPHYDIGIWENHHTQKKDRPSGTALMVAQSILQELERKTNIISDIPQAKKIPSSSLAVVSQRIGYERGFHEVIIDSDYDTIKISHSARNRSGFAMGAITAAEWLCLHQKDYVGQVMSVETWITQLLAP